MKMEAVIPPHRGLDVIAENLISGNSNQLLADRLSHHLRPDEGLNASEWSGKYRVLPDGGMYKRWKPALTPFHNEIAEMMRSDSPEHRFVCISKPSQVGLTDLAIGEMLRVISTAPTSMIYYRETGDKIKEFQRTRLFPALRLPPFATRRDVEIKGEDIYYPGGYLVCRGVGSANALAGTTARIVIGDEVAKMAENIQGAGDFFSLASQRSSTFGDKAKAILFSTPRERSEGAEGTFFQLIHRGDVRRFFCPCPKCGEKWDWAIEHLKKYEEAGEEKFGLECPSCQNIMADEERIDSLQKGVWKPTQEPRPGFVSYEVNGLHGWTPLRSIYHKYEDAAAGRASMATFQNEVLGEFYSPVEARRATPNHAKVVMTKEVYQSGEVPDKVAILTMAIDVGLKQLDYEIRGFTHMLENYSITRGILTDDHGVHLTIDKTQDVMIAIRKLLDAEWKRKDGRVMKVRLAAIDYGGPEGTAPAVRQLLNFWPRVSYDKKNVFVPQGTLIAVKGNGNVKVNPRLHMFSPGDRTSQGVRRRTPAFTLGVDRGKFELARALKAPEDSDEPILGRPHAPIDYPDEYWEEITAEEIVVERDPKDGRVKQWFRQPPGKRNEAMDLWVYTRACCEIMRLYTYRKEDWDALREREAYHPDKPKKPEPKPGSVDAQREKIKQKRIEELRRRREARMKR